MAIVRIIDVEVNLEIFYLHISAIGETKGNLSITYCNLSRNLNELFCSF